MELSRSYGEYESRQQVHMGNRADAEGQLYRERRTTIHWDEVYIKMEGRGRSNAHARIYAFDRIEPFP